MKYRLFITNFEDVKQQFNKNYNSVISISNKEEFQDCLEKIRIDTLYDALLINHSLLNNEEILYKIKEIENNFRYIVLCGPEKEIKKLYRKLYNLKDIEGKKRRKFCFCNKKNDKFHFIDIN